MCSISCSSAAITSFSVFMLTRHLEPAPLRKCAWLIPEHDIGRPKQHLSIPATLLFPHRLIDCKPSVPQAHGSAGTGSRARKVFVGGLSPETSEGGSGRKRMDLLSYGPTHHSLFASDHLLHVGCQQLRWFVHLEWNGLKTGGSHSLHPSRMQGGGGARRDAKSKQDTSSCINLVCTRS